MRKVTLAAAIMALALMAGTVRAVVINEFYYGTAAPGDNEWVEIYNKSTNPISLNNWKIKVSNNTPWTQVINITQGRDTGTTVSGQDFFLVADGAAAGLDYDINNTNLNLGRATGNVVYGIALIDDRGTTIDTVLYSVPGAPNTLNLRDDDNLTTRVRAVTGDQSYSRADDTHADTNNSSADFFGTGSTGTPVPVQIRRFSLY